MSLPKASDISDASACDPDGVSGKALAKVAKLIGNPTCAQVLDALLSDRRLTVSALAGEIGTARPTVSEAVGALAAAGLVHRETHGRTTVVRLSGDEVAEALESLGRLARPLPAVGLRAVSRMEKLQRGRTCYDHFAGELGVTLADCLLSAGVLSVGADRETWFLAEEGSERLIDLGLEQTSIAATGRRPLVRACPDWTEHRPHVAGRLGAAICVFWLRTGMAQRLPTSRAVRVTRTGEEWLVRLLASGPK